MPSKARAALTNSALRRARLQDADTITLVAVLKNWPVYDRDFADPKWPRHRYCLVWLAVKQDLLAEYARRLLRHPEFDTSAIRLAKVLTVDRQA